MVRVIMKVGNYVRTEISSLNLQRIGKIKEIISEDFIHTDIGTYDKENIIKSSPNIIDLIEVGDIVNYERLNGGVVLNKKDDSIDTWSIFPNSLKNEDIKSVITKEQLKNCMYKVGD